MMAIDSQSHIKVHTDEQTQVHSTHSSLMVTHPSTNRGRRYLTSMSNLFECGVNAVQNRVSTGQNSQ